LGAREFVGAKNKSGGSYLRYYEYRKMIAAKIVVVQFFGRRGAKNLGGAAAPLRPPSCTVFAQLNYGSFIVEAS